MKNILTRFALLATLIFGANCSAKNPSYQKISAQEASEQMSKTKAGKFIIVDVRTPREFDAGHVADAKILTLNTLKDNAESVIPNKKTIVYVYCRSGKRSAMAANQLLELGYKKVYDFGGIIDKGFTEIFPLEISSDVPKQ